VKEEQPDRAAVWTFQEAEVIGGSEVEVKGLTSLASVTEAIEQH
jgi:hypothetical protein